VLVVNILEHRNSAPTCTRVCHHLNPFNDLHPSKLHGNIKSQGIKRRRGRVHAITVQAALTPKQQLQVASAAARAPTHRPRENPLAHRALPAEYVYFHSWSLCRCFLLLQNTIYLSSFSSTRGQEQAAAPRAQLVVKPLWPALHRVLIVLQVPT